MVIPLATAVVEEVIFRGVLHGLLRRRLEVWPAAVCGAFLFGLWHVYPAWLDEGGAGDAGVGPLDRRGRHVRGHLCGRHRVTWLRERSGHLVAPVLCHTATNSATFAVAWIAAN